ncbi:hypothetical protein JYP49_21815 [Nitratireductor aquimarinus]|uniref:hypothetical protein n=1 Tax=Nitratireductor TaxID=245876 RepID=UPI0019D3C957|nr:MULTISPECIES: hypothetical protein [Nitratireductor]MBN7778897.1 hypothetical protein [Nitratireductor pacificus]MBN7783234.1 hypothetical protein [Nitratireductor pacificus]MBN7792035.1 hypothetical protein [Nitratireductor aquimarinus]MBY6101282.1 hypothetical protein [Nitratireductor aquimarinus]MCA1262569.1 hypothetical protein [Nitratireductor aquimarinus]
MPVENTTPNRNYPLPFRENELRDDVARIISAISGVDLDVANILSSLALKSEDGHGHVISDVTGLAAAIAAKQDADQKGLANGFASLGSDGKVPTSQLPAAVLGALSYQGTWNANTNSPTIPAASASNRGWYYKVATAGATSIGGIDDWKVGDWIVSNGTIWDKVDNTESVVSVAGLDGVIGATELLAAIGAATAAQGVKADAALPIAAAGILAGHRNKIINGDLGIWQRGFGPYSGNGFTADRWYVTGNGGGWTFQRSSNLGYEDWPHAKAIGQMYYDGNGSTPPIIAQPIEDVRTLANRKLTFGVRCKAAQSGLTLGVRVFQYFGAGGSPTIEVLPLTAIGAISDSSATVVSGTVDLPSVQGKTFGSGHYLAVEFRPMQNVPMNFDWSEVFVVEGDATAEVHPFSPRDTAQELVMCQRYLETLYDPWYLDQQAGTVVSLSGTDNEGANSFLAVAKLTFKVTKRAVPTLVNLLEEPSDSPAHKWRILSPDHLIVGAAGNGVRARVSPADTTQKSFADAEL